MLRFPTAEDRGEGVIIEVLGRTGDPKVDTTAVIRALGMPDTFPEEALEEARAAGRDVQRGRPRRAARTSPTQLVITIDPVDAQDFDDAVSLTRDAKTGHWLLTVHIADVAHFAPPGGPLDREARERGTSVYLPQRVIPMFPEVISNGLASLQEGQGALRQDGRDGVHRGRRAGVGAVRQRGDPEPQAIHLRAGAGDPRPIAHGDAAKGVAP